MNVHKDTDLRRITFHKKGAVKNESFLQHNFIFTFRTKSVYTVNERRIVKFSVQMIIFLPLGKNIVVIKYFAFSESDNLNIKRGDIYYADLSPVVGSEQGGVRPVLIVQNDVGNKYSPTVIAAAITSQQFKTRLPTHICVDAAVCGLSKDSVVLLEQIRTLDKQRLREKMGNLPDADMSRINDALSVSMGLNK